MKTISVLGTEYSIKECSEEEDSNLEKCNGYCDKTTKEIVITTKTKECDLSDWEWYRKKTLRHEIVHAFFFESGLQENFENRPYGIMETLVDWIAIQMPKMIVAMEQVGAL